MRLTQAGRQVVCLSSDSVPLCRPRHTPAHHRPDSATGDSLTTACTTNCSFASVIDDSHHAATLQQSSAKYHALVTKHRNSDLYISVSFFWMPSASFFVKQLAPYDPSHKVGQSEASTMAPGFSVLHQYFEMASYYIHL